MMKIFALKPSRIALLDALRGWAVAMMMVFHLMFDLSHFGFIHFDIYHGQWEFAWASLIRGMFFVAIGWSLVVVHRQGIDLQRFYRRWIPIALAALAVSLATWVIFPKAWVYFGVLHFIALASLLALPLVRLPILAFLAALFVYVLWWQGISWDFLQGFISFLPRSTVDWVPLFPWIAWVFVGIVVGYWQGLAKVRLPSWLLPRWIAWLGQHALLVYLLHQLVLFSLVAVLAFVLH